MEIKRLNTFDLDAIKQLYLDVGWQAYLKDMKTFGTMFEASQHVLVAIIDDTIVGLVRVVGDGAHIAYIQDLLVATAHQRKGIGRSLLKAALDAVSGVRQKVLITDADDQRAQRFYEAVGLKRAKEANISCYVRLETSV